MLSQLDLEVLKNLPLEIISEMNVMHKGELHGFLDSLNSDKGKESSSKSLVPAVTRNSVPTADVKLQGYGGHKDSMHSEEGTKGKSVEQPSEVQAANDASCSRVRELAQLDLMPDSLSRADLTVLQELPEDVKADLFNMLPLHRPGDPACRTSIVPEKRIPIVDVVEDKAPNDSGADDSRVPRIFLPPGSPQKWIKQFRVSSCLILNVIAEQHSGSSRPLSTALEPLASFLPMCPNSGTEEWNENILLPLRASGTVYTTES